jgi:predicted permease
LRGLAADLRSALRSLRNAPGFSLAAILTLGLGIGLNAAIFSAVYGVLLRPLDLPQPERLYTVWQNMEARGGKRQDYTGFGVFSDWRARNRCFEGMAAFAKMPMDLGDIEPPESVPGAWVSHEYFSVLGVKAVRGRGFLKEEETKAKNSVAVLSSELWARRFGSDPSIVGKSITVNYAPVTVVGILPPGFRAPLTPEAELWTPMPLEPPPDDRPFSYISVIGRLKPGVSPAAAQADMRRVAASLEADYRASMHGVGVTLLPALEAVVGSARRPLLLLLGAVSLVLLIACVNVGNLALSRAMQRRSELALRIALGAGRDRIARLFAAESAWLGVGGAALGLLLGVLYLALLRRLAPPQTPRLDSIRLDGAVAAVTFAISLAVSLLAGLLPAFWGSRRRPFEALREASGATSGRRGQRWRGALIVAEIAASLLLLVGTGMLLRTLAALMRVDPGFRTEKVVLGRVSVRPSHLPKLDDVAAFFARVEERLVQRPEIKAAGVVAYQPLADGNAEMGFSLDGQGAAAEERQTALWRWVSPGYFNTVGMPLVAGRLSRLSDSETSRPVILVNEQFVGRFLAGRNVLGRRLRSVQNEGDDAPWRVIVGVVGDVRGRSLDRRPEPEVYLPLRQQQPTEATVVARAAGSSAAALQAMQEVIRQVRPGQVLARPDTMEQVIVRGISPRRFAASLVGTFAAVALLLAAVGVYGVTVLAVSQRRRELAVRLALGAPPFSIAGIVLRWIALLVAAGIAMGLVAAVAAGRLMTAILFGVGPTDGLTLGAAGLALALIALGTCLWPAVRAARMDPFPVLNGGG